MFNVLQPFERQTRLISSKYILANMRDVVKLIVAVLFVLSSCVKDELTKPAEVAFEFSMKSYLSDQSTQTKSTNNNFFSLSKGTLVIDAIEFDGKRSAGKDYFFKSNFPKTLNASLETGITNFKVEFDIPQGIYNKIDLTFLFTETGVPSLVLEGVFSSGSNFTTPIRFEYTYPDNITVRASTGSDQTIVLQKDKKSRAIVTIDASFIFRFINPGVIASASTSNVNGENIILINDKNNIPIFNQIASRINNAITVQFE
jgi:hypothetical protein